MDRYEVRVTKRNKTEVLPWVADLGTALHQAEELKHDAKVVVVTKNGLLHRIVK